MNPQLVRQILAVALVALFPALWLAASWIISVIGGWSSLATNYRATIPTNGPTWWFQSLHLEPLTNYNNVVFVTAAAQGLALSVFFPFSAWHPPLLIPWQDICAVRRPGWFGYEFVVLSFSQSSVVMVISGRLANRIKAVATDRWPEPSQACPP